MIITSNILNYISRTSKGHVFDNNHDYYQLYKKDIIKNPYSQKNIILINFYTDWFKETFLTQRWVLELITKGTTYDLFVLFEFLKINLNETTVHFFAYYLSYTIIRYFDTHELSESIILWTGKYLDSNNIYSIDIDNSDISSAKILNSMFHSK